MQLIKWVLFLSVFMSTTVHAEENNTPVDSEATAKQVKALKSAIQREAWGIILSETFELQEEEIKEGKIFKNHDKFSLKKYQDLMIDICVKEKTSTCPEALFTTKENIQVASMYPNGKMLINVRVLDRLSDSEVYFVIAHEMGHFVLRHSLLRTQQIADAVVDNGFMVAETEKLVGAAFLLPGMKEFHHKSEDEADMFAAKYLKAQNIKINCLQMFEKMLNGEKASDEKHASVEQRCKIFQE